VRGPAATRFVLGRRLAFGNASATMLLVMAAAGIPAPLYPLYQEQFGVTAVGLTTSYGTYILMACMTMLTLGRISDHVGRRAATLTAMLLAGISCVVFIAMDGTATLVIGRGLQGMAVGLAMSSIGALVIDLKEPGTEFLASLVASASPTVGVALGAIASGLAIEYGPRPLIFMYATVLGLLIVLSVGIHFTRETVDSVGRGIDRRSALASLRPAISVPASARPVFIGAVAAFVAAWTLGGFYQSLGPTLATSVFPEANHVFSGLVVASVLGMTFAGGPVTARLAPRPASLVGLTMLIVGVLGILGSLAAGSSALFLATSMLAGVGFGASTTGAMRTLLLTSDHRSSAGLLSAIYLVAYVCAAFPAFLGGFFVEPFGLNAVTHGYGAVVIGLAILAGVLIVVTGPRRTRGRPSRP